MAFACLPCPSCGYELAILELGHEFGLVGGWFETEVFSAELHGFFRVGVFLFFFGFYFQLVEFSLKLRHGHCFSSAPMVLRSSSSSVLICVTS